MTSLTINLEEALKENAQKKAKKNGVTLTFVITQALMAYHKNQLRFGMLSDDDEVTVSFDVTTAKGKKACLKDFESLAR